MKTGATWKQTVAALVCGAAMLSPVAGQRAFAHTGVNYYYDAGGRLTYISLGGGRSIEYIYDSSSNLLRKTITVFSDTDADQLNDAWEQQYFGGLSRTGTADFDGDGMSDLNEHLAGTDPLDAQSLLKVALLKEGGGNYSIEWPSVPGRRYLLQYKDDLNHPVWTNLFDPFVAASTLVSRQDASGSPAGIRFYRLLVVTE